MPIINTFKKCDHGNNPPEDWRECYVCIDEITTNVMIARTYFKELAEGVFNENGDMVIPVSEPIRGQHFSRIAATALGVIS